MPINSPKKDDYSQLLSEISKLTLTGSGETGFRYAQSAAIALPPNEESIILGSSSNVLREIYLINNSSEAIVDLFWNDGISVTAIPESLNPNGGIFQDWSDGGLELRAKSTIEAQLKIWVRSAKPIDYQIGLEEMVPVKIVLYAPTNRDYLEGDSDLGNFGYNLNRLFGSNNGVVGHKLFAISQSTPGKKVIPKLSRLKLSEDPFYDLWEFSEYGISFGSDLDGSNQHSFSGFLYKEYYCYNVHEIKSKLTDEGGGFYTYNGISVNIFNTQVGVWKQPFKSSSEYYLAPGGSSIFLDGNEEDAFYKADYLGYFFWELSNSEYSVTSTTTNSTFVDGKYTIVTESTTRPNTYTPPSRGIFKQSGKTIDIVNFYDIPQSSPPRQPPPDKLYKKDEKMDDNCCEMIEEIYEALNVKELLNQGFIIPNRMIVPGGKETTKLENYLEILNYQMRQVDHVGIHPFELTIKDTNKAIAGDQPLKIQFPNATAAIKYISELAQENKGDAANRLSLLIRISFAVAQLTTILVQTARGIKALGSYFGMPPVERIEKVKLPFDILLGIKPEPKGFGQGTTKSGEQIKAELMKKIDQNTEDATEAMLPDFMKVAELEVKTEDFRPSPEFDFWVSLKRTLRID